MDDYLVNLRFSELNRTISEIRNDLVVLKNSVTSNEALWDGSDIVNKWHVSPRTLADWRKKKLIEYIQVNKKIYYSKEHRENFLNENSYRKGGSNG